MAAASIFIFDSAFSSADVALAIDETKHHVIVSDCVIEVPPGQSSVVVEEVKCFASLGRNLRLLRAAWRNTGGESCIIIATPRIPKFRLLLNVVYSRSLCGSVVLFDGINFTSLTRSWKLILAAISRVLAKKLLRGLGVRIQGARLERRLRRCPDWATPEGLLFGLFTSANSFSVPLDKVSMEPCGRSIYGDFAHGWYLPTFSNHRQRYLVQTTRHRLSNVVLHLEEVPESAVRFLFKGDKVLDYPYFLGKARPNACYEISTRKEVKNIERGIDLLYYTSGYYHWIVEGVPRILDLIDDGIDLIRYPLIMPPLEAFHREVLGVLGISVDDQVIIMENGDWCHVGDCIVPTANFPFAVTGVDDPSGHPNGELLRRIRDRVLERLVPATPVSCKRVYISRSMAAKRKFTSDTELAIRAILEARGFRTICLEELPWTHQVSLISEAEFIVGLHGAGLANMLFAKAKSLLEFQNPLETRAYFALMARELDMKYGFVVGKLQGNSNNFDNLGIDLDSVVDMLRQLDPAGSSAA